MRGYIFLAVIFYLKISSISAQSVVDFLNSYNKHIDPFERLDTTQVLTLKMVTKIRYSASATINEINRTRVCKYYANGDRNCFNTDGSTDHLEKYPIPLEYDGNAIKYQLEFIPIDEPDLFSFLLITDSITVIEKVVGKSETHVFTFDNKTMNLLQRSTVSRDTGYVSFTNYESYQIVCGILIRKKISFNNQFSTATIEFDDVEFSSDH
ncbi:MAG TPA: hypothetical protein PLV21_12550 [Cyclobacteriaceae bacterium]|nr:hypothetical protein [Cyclobacteriaceae bacterium]HRJ82713.1 hypothetical protein [Cyclobacteriaceae bacterium]